MIQILIVSGVFLLAIMIFGFGLHFSKYKKRNSGCCGGGHCSDGGTPGSCYDEKTKFVNNYKS